MRASFFTILSATIASTASALPAAAAHAAAEPDLIDLAPFKGTMGFPTRPVMSVEEALARTAKVKADAEAWDRSKNSQLAVRCASDNAREYAAGRARSTCKNPEVRVEWRNFPHEYRLLWVKAARCVYDLPPHPGHPAAAKSMAESMAYVHQQLMENIHSVGHFNVWHRLFLWHYQEILRNQCGYPRELPLPWWDESKDAGKFSQASIFGPDYYGEAPPVVVKDGKGYATCVRTGAFANLTISIGPVRNLTTPHCLSRAVNETETAQTGKAFVDLGNSFPSFWDMAVSQEEGPHAFGHTGVGSVMGDMWASPSDALFYMHHTFTDRNFWAWQQANPSNRTYQIGGMNATVGPATASTLDSPIRFMGLFNEATIRPLQDTQGGSPFCYVYDY
ncbi:hypothetical protein RB594_006955 [Gaeumannomyces avenae]